MTLRIEFVKLGTNQEGAVFGDLTLRDGSTPVVTASAFSGGNSFNPIDDGTYRLCLDIRGDEGTDEANTDGTMKPFYGIQKVSDNVQDSSGTVWDMQVEWGTIRARLNPQPGSVDHGDYIHGKKRPRDYTHGCICDRSEAVLNYLWNLDSPPAALDVVVSGGAQFDLDVLVKKNFAKKVTPDAKVKIKVSSKR